ncbi:MAG TPA: GTP-binding protein [candidate division Zixibacteria bacterium]|nr:GTP-binding protein [candidate division Zixibacteria bacterium]
MSKLYQRKIVLLGDPGVGKTSLVQRYIFDHFQRDYMTTLGLNFYVRTFEYPDAEVKLMIWDIAGQKSRRKIGLRYLQGASGALLAYDLTNQETFDNLPSWYEDLVSANGRDVPVVIVGTKLDLAQTRQIPLAYNIKKFGDLPAAKANLIFTSAKTDTNVDAAFNLIIQELVSGLIPSPDISPKIHEESATKILFFVQKDDAWSKIALNHIEKVGKKFALEVETIDAERDPKLLDAYGVKAFPTILVGGRHLVGIVQIAHLENLITQMLEVRA